MFHPEDNDPGQVPEKDLESVDHTEDFDDDVELDGESEAETQEPEQTEETSDDSVEPDQEQDFDSIDPNTLPPEMQKIAKGFQSSYTKKMQGLQQLMDNLQPHQERLGLLDKAIAGDPHALQQLQRISGVQQPQPQQSQSDPYAGVPEDFETTTDMVKYMDQRVMGAMNAFASQFLPQFMEQQLAPFKKMQEAQSDQAVQANIDTLRQSYPDFDRHIDGIIAEKKSNPNLTMEQAYKLASYKKPTPPSAVSRSKPGKRPTSVAPKKSGKVSWADAYEAAKSEINGR